MVNYPPKPPAFSRYDRDRQEHSALRRRMITGSWEEDLEQELLSHLSADRRESWGPSDLSSNALEQVTRQLSVLYTEPPSITNTSDADLTPLVGRDGLLPRSGLYSLMQRVQQLTLALRECFLRIDIVDYVEGKKGVRFRPVTPDMVVASSSEDNPDDPLYYQESRLRYNKMKDKYEWIADVFDIRDRKNPKFSLHRIDTNGKLGDDVTEIYLNMSALEGDNYPYRYSNGVPFLPLVLFHAERTGQLFNAFDNSTLTYGSLTSAVLFSMYLHLIKNCCFGQRYIAGLTLAGQSAVDQNDIARRATVATDPSSILVFASDPDIQGQPLIGTFEPSEDPQKMLESIAKYEYRVATTAGISSEVLRQSGDPRSGYALSISREGQRESQKTYAQVFRGVEQSLLSKVACMANKFLGFSLPEEGYRVQYTQLKLSPEEMKAVRQDVIEKLQAGLISPVDAIMQLNPDLDDIEARNELKRIKLERAEFM